MAEFLVTTLADEDNGAINGMSLREAIQLANANGNTGIQDVITFASDLAGQTITLTEGPLVITDDLRIDGDVLGDTTGKDAGRADDITITTAMVENFASQITVTPKGYTSPGTVTLEEAVGTFGDFRIFEVRQDGTDAAFNALTLTGAGVYSGGNLLPAYGQMGAAIFQADYAAGTTGTFPENTAFPQTWDDGAGDLELAVKTTVEVTHSTISDNFGAAIVAGHRFTMEDSILSGNHGGFAAGIFIAALEGEATLRDVHVKDHDLISARATLGTGAPGAEFIIEDSEITNNRMVDTNAGGALVSTGAGVFFSGSPGGGISITDSVVKDNQGILAGAIATGSPDQDITVKNSVFENNVARSDWLATYGGGAIGLAATGADVYVEGSSFVENKNVANGGGAFAIGGTSNLFEIVNSTLTGNVSGKSGGAIGFQGTSNKMALVNSTVVDNHVVETPITDLNGLTEFAPGIIADSRGSFQEFGSTGGLFQILSYERFAFNGGDTQTRIENSIIAGNTNLGAASDVRFELGFGDAIDFLTDNGIRFDPDTGRTIVDPSLQDLSPADRVIALGIVENYDLVVENSLIGAGFQSGNWFDRDQDGIPDRDDDDDDGDGILDSVDTDIPRALTFDFPDDGINTSTNIIGTRDAPVDPMLAAATIAENGQTVLTPLANSPVIDAGDNAFLNGVNTAPQGTVDGLLDADIAAEARILDGDGNGDARVDIGAVELDTTVTEAVYFAGGSGFFSGQSPRDVYQLTEDGARLLFDGSDVLRFGTIDGLDVIAADEILLSFATKTYIRGLGFVDDSDIVLFKATSLGENTEGSFEMYFDGSDVGLTSFGEDVDGFSLAEDGSLLLSTRGRASVEGVSKVRDEDVLIFRPASLGEETAGDFEMYFDGSDVGLGGFSFSRDVDAVALQGDGSLLLSTTGAVRLDDAFATRDDVVSFSPTSLGDATAGSYSEAAGPILPLLDVSGNLGGVDVGAFDHDLLLV